MAQVIRCRRCRRWWGQHNWAICVPGQTREDEVVLSMATLMCSPDRAALHVGVLS